ncbi:MAG: glycosyltransferase family 39 protein [Oscillospiraceae bacterium]|jgi:hypothetical protein|nr:glycosyltransferase family 39 protein [Oscillospiraceae bacterium]
MIKNNAITKALFLIGTALFALLACKNLYVLIDKTVPLFSNRATAAKSLLLFSAVLVACAAVVYVVDRFCRRENAVPERKGTIKYYYIALFFIAYALRFVWISTVKTPQYSDFQLFYWITNNIASGSSRYTTDPYFYTWAYQAGFPAFMAPFAVLFPQNELALVYVNCLFEAGTVLCIFYLLRKFFSRKSAFVLSLVYLVFPFPYTLASVYTNQLSAVFFMYLGVCIAFSRIPLDGARCCVGAVCFAVGNMLRPEGILFFSGFAALLLFLTFHQNRDARSALSAKVTNSLLRRVLPLVLFCAVYLCLSAVISQLFVWANLNPNGLKNNFPLYKFATGLNASSTGQYTKEDATFLMSLDSDYDAKTRDAMTLDIIHKRLSIGPVKLAAHMWRKADVMWTDKQSTFPALAPFSDNDVISLGVSMRVVTLKNILTLIDGLYWLLLFLFGAFSQFRLFRRREVSPCLLFAVILFLGTFFVFSVVEVQKRYDYIMLPVLFLLAAVSLKSDRTKRAHKDCSYGILMYTF